jgi:hypothetical protein
MAAGTAMETKNHDKRNVYLMCGILFVLALFALGFIGGATTSYTLALILGWLFYLLGVLPKVRVNGSSVLMAIGCISIFAVGFHWWMSWLFASIGQDATADEGIDEDGSEDGSEVDDEPNNEIADDEVGVVDAPRPWRLRWTASIVVIVVMMFVIGIAVTGVAHQTAWLVKDVIRVRAEWGK